MVGEASGTNGQTKGTYDNNLRIDSIMYDVYFTYEQVKEYTINIFAETMLAQALSEGFSTILFDGIFDHKVPFV